MNLKSNKGSIAVFVLVGLLFMSAFLIISFANIANKSKTAKEQYDIIKGIYYKGNDEESYDDAYSDLRNKNKQICTQTIEYKSEIELENESFEEEINELKIYGTGALNTLPNEYQKIEYIETTGTQYLNTGVPFNMETGSIELKFKSTNIEQRAMPIGTNTGGNTFWFYQISRAFKIYILNNLVGSVNADTDIHKMKYINKEYFMDNELIGKYNDLATITSTNIYLFSCGTRHLWCGRIYYFKMYNDGVLIRDFVPCYRKVDQKIGMYDMANDIFYTLIGTNISSLIINEISDELLNGVGDKIIDSTDPNYDKYILPIKMININNEYIIYNIYLNSPLLENEYIEYSTGKVYRNNGIIEYIELPQINTFENYTKMEILTQNDPLKIEIEYMGYKMNTDDGE